MSAASGPVAFGFSAGASTPLPAATPGEALLMQRQEQRTDLNFALRAGAFSFQAWQGQNGVAPAPGLAAASDAFASLSRADHVMRAAFDLRGVTFAAEMGSGSRQWFLTETQLQPSSYALTSVGIARNRWSASLSAGRLTEPEGPLGSILPGDTAFSMPAVTNFGTLHADFAASRRLVLSAEASLGRTQVQNAFLTETAPLISSSWRLTARTQCGGGVDDCLHFELDVSQPVRIESGTFGAWLADVPTDYNDPLVFSHRSFSAAPTGRELDLRFGVDRSLPGLGMFQLQAITARDAGNYQGQPLDLGLLANWRTRF